jgi:hypothetical protein
VLVAPGAPGAHPGAVGAPRVLGLGPARVGLGGDAGRSSFPASVHPVSISVRVCRRAHGGRVRWIGQPCPGVLPLGLASAH